MFESLRKIPAMALGTAPISGYSRRRGYQYIWLGAGEGPGRPPILWRVLCRQSAGEGYRDSAGRLFEGRPLLLLSDCLLGDHPVFCLAGQRRPPLVSEVYQILPGSRRTGGPAVRFQKRPGLSPLAGFL